MKESETNLPNSHRPTMIAIGLGAALPILAIGFMLGFFPALWGDGGSVEKGLDHGWKMAIVFTLTMAVIGVVHSSLKPTSLPPIMVSILMGMVGMAIMYTAGRLVTGEDGSWQRNLLSGLGNGAFIGAVVHGASRWQAKRMRPQL